MGTLKQEVVVKLELKVKAVDSIGEGMARIQLDGALWTWMSFTVPIGHVRHFPLTGKVTVEVMENADTPLGFSCCREGSQTAGYSSPLHACSSEQCGHSSEDNCR